jgi:hypothetical protein
MNPLFRPLILAGLMFAPLLLSGCANHEISDGGISIYYTIDGSWASPQDGCVEVVATMTLPDGSESHGNTCTPFTSDMHYYQAGTAVSITAEPVRPGAVITVKIYRNGDLWRTQTIVSSGSGHYAAAQVLATL